MDRLTPPDYEPNVFDYIGEPEPHEKYIDVTIITLGGKKKARLPRKLIQRRFIMIFPNDKQVSIPGFLCKKEGLA